jgi:hypothetical protein
VLNGPRARRSRPTPKATAAGIDLETLRKRSAYHYPPRFKRFIDVAKVTAGSRSAPDPCDGQFETVPDGAKGLMRERHGGLGELLDLDTASGVAEHPAEALVLATW